MKTRIKLLVVMAGLAVCGCHGRKNTETATIIPSVPQAQDTASAMVTEDEEGDSVFTATGYGTASKYERLMDAQLRADQDALAAAVNRTGADIVSGYSDLLSQAGKNDTQAVSRYLLSMSAAAVSWARVSPPVCGMGPDGSTKCTVSIHGRIRQRGPRDASFNILLSDDLKPMYKNGESVSFTAHLSQKAYLYIFSVDEEQNAYMVFPNTAMRSNLLEPGQKVQFPDKLAGVSLTAALLPQRDGASEILHLVACKQPLLTLEDTREKATGQFKLISAGTMSSLMGKLGALDRDQWTMQVIPYQIVR